jgi:ATF/CREB family transcription factor
MFPAPSPNTQAILSQLQSGGATPSTLEFHRTALNAAKRSGFNVPTSNPTSEPEQLQNMDKKTAPPAVDQFTHHDAADAANGLFMLAKGGQPNNDAFSAPTNKPADIPDTKRATRNAHNSVSSGRELTAEGSDTQGEQAKPAKGKGKKNTPAKQTSTVNGRRKAEEAPKGSNKRAKMNHGPMEMTPEEESDDEDMKDDLNGKDPKKMTDEEKRKNFLERNRYVIRQLMYISLRSRLLLMLIQCRCPQMSST